MPFPKFHAAKYFALKWTPRAIAVFLGGYYSLGLAYDFEFMMQIDKILIKLLKYFLGHVGVGMFMPTFQWYAAWGVRCLSALAAGYLYSAIEKTVLLIIKKQKQKRITTIPID